MVVILQALSGTALVKVRRKAREENIERFTIDKSSTRASRSEQAARPSDKYKSQVNSTKATKQDPSHDRSRAVEVERQSSRLVVEVTGR